MFSLLESKKEIEKAQLALEKTIQIDSDKRAIKNIGSPGGTLFEANVFNNGRYWFFSKDYNARRLNYFGIFRNAVDLQAAVQINTPYGGFSNRIAGSFVKNNDTGMTYLFHSGRVGGGKEGVGKAEFLAWCAKENKKLVFKDVRNSSGHVRKGILVMLIEGKMATNSAIRYINIIHRFKQQAAPAPSAPPPRPSPGNRG